MIKQLRKVTCTVLSILLAVTAFAQAPVANFSANITSGCSPIVVQFADLSTNTPTSWYWDLGNGNTSTIQNPSTTYINPGTYTVSLTATNGSGNNTKTVVSYITVAPSPTVAFTGDSSISCTLPRTIVFTNNSVLGSSGTPSYLWDFGDGTTSTAANPTKIYTTYGNFNVTLVVTNGAGCTQSLTKTGYIKNMQRPATAFTATGANACNAPANVSFTNTTSGGFTYYWDFGDGGNSTSTSPSHTYTSTGTYTVTLIATNSAGCKDTLVATNYVTVGKPTAAFNASTFTGCSGRNIFFNNTSSPTGFTSDWDFADGGTSTATNPVHAFTAAGNYNVRLIVTNNGCSDTVYHNVNIAAVPSVNFYATPVSGCVAPFNTTFTNLTAGGSSYMWYFGDGGTSTSTSPTHTYTALGSYNVKLVAIGGNGCSDSFTQLNYINVTPPSAAIITGTYSGCAPVNISFYANVNTTIPVSNYSWNFGDGSSVLSCSSCGGPTHTYTTAGTYTVTLTYTTGTGCTYTAQTTVTIAPKPTASFTATPTTICPGAPVAFTNNSTGTVTSYVWMFGNGASSNATNPTYSGYRYGTYTVSLVAENNGCADTFTRTNYINVLLPDANFNLTRNCSTPYNITLIDASTGASTYFWDFGDGSTSTQNGGTLTHTYSTTGVYTVSLLVTNTSTGCSSTFSQQVRINPLVAAFTVADTTLCKGVPTVFTAAPSPNIVTYYWDLGGGVTYTMSPPFNWVGDYYTTGGNYTVKLVVTDAAGCKDSLIKTNHVHVGPPIVDFTASPLTGCVPMNVTFTDQSVPTGFPISSRAWSFGNGVTQNTTASTIPYSYPTSGVYTVKLVVTDANGCKDSLTKNNYISASKPYSGFIANDTTVCKGDSITFTNISSGTSLTYAWDFGDGGTSTTLTPKHAYSTLGTYTVRLITTDAGGCKDTMTRISYIVVSGPTANFSLSDTVENCPPLLVNCTDLSSGAATYAWSFGNGGQSTLANPTTVFTYPGVYGVKQIVINAAGCKDSITKNVTVYGPTGTFSYAPIAGCRPLTVSFSATTSNTSQFIWDMGNGYTQNTTTASLSYTYTQSGRYLPKLILSDGASCLVPLQGIDTIKVDYLDADFNFSTTGPLCYSGTVQFTDTVTASLTTVTSRAWQFGDGGTSTAHNPSHTYTAPGTYNVRLIVGNSQGCADTIIKTVIVHALPNVTASGANTICQGSTTGVTLTASGATSYVWSPATGLSCTNCTTTIALPSSTTTYIVTGTDANGCIDTGNVTVTIAPLPNVTASPNVSICSGSSTVLTATGASSYTWIPATGLSCTNCASPTANPTTTTTYIVTGTNASTGCTDTGMVTVTVNPSPTISAGSNVTICNGSSTTLTATGGTSYTWAPTTGLSCTNCASPTASPTTTTTYTVTGTDGSGCSSTASVTVTVNPRPTISAGSNTAICNGNSVTLTATGGTSYTWAPTTGLSCSNCASPVASPTTTTTYTVTGTDANGCTNTASVTVTVNNKPNVTATGNNIICNGNSTTLTGNGAVLYSWTPATGLSCTACTSPVASPTTTTTYIVTGTDANGCTDTGMITVTVNTKPVISAGNNRSICLGSSTTLTATGASTYVWSPGATLSCTNCTSPVATPVTTTTYTVIGTSVNGCLDTDQVTVTVNTLPTVGAGSPKSICAGSSTTLTGSGAISYTWSPATGLSCTACASPVASPSTTTTYTVTGTDGNGCTNTSTVLVTVNPIPVVTTTGGGYICLGDSSFLGVSGATTYTWSPGGTLTCTNCTNPIATPISSTTYMVIGNSNNCLDTEYVTVNVRPKPQVTAGLDQEICIGASAMLEAKGANTYLWTPATGLSCTNCAMPTATPTISTMYFVTGTDADGCKGTSFVRVIVHDLPNVNAGNDTAICDGASLQLNGKGAYTYIWTPGTALSCTTCANPVATPTVKTTYTLTGSDNIGCTNSDDITIDIIKKNVISFSDDKDICMGGSVTLNADGGTIYEWLPAGGGSNSILVSPTVNTKYTITIKQGSCFVDTGYINVRVHDNPVAELGPDKFLHGGGSVVLEAGEDGITHYEWLQPDYLSCTGCGKPTAAPRRTTHYVVKLTNQFGCTASDDITVHVTCDQSQVFVPNTFTPNNDGVNDYFYPQGKGLSEVRSFKVYNRWGELIFERQNMPLNEPTAGWDGMHKGSPLKPDVFVYIIRAFCESGEPIELKGDISLVR